VKSGGVTELKTYTTISNEPRWYALELADDPTYWTNVRTDRILILLEKGWTLEKPEVNRLLERYGVTEILGKSMYPDILNFYELKLPGGDRAKVLSFIREAKRIEGIVVAEPVVMYSAMGCPPNDPYWSYQWGPYVIWADSAWCYETGDTSVMVAVLDQGVDWYHEDLYDNVWYGYDYVDNDSDPTPDDPSVEHHGTHVAGVIAATLNNSTGIAGMANVFVFAGRVLDESGSGSSTTIANAILDVSNNPRIRVINMSLGASSPSYVMEAACDTAWNRGVLLVAASGNDGSYGISYPAAYSSVIAVGSIGTDGSSFYLASYSNYGPEQELTAPGGDASTGYCILSTLPSNNYGDVGAGCSWVGTSMAAPHVSGVAALVFSHRPSLTNTEVRNLLDATAIDLGDSGWDQYYGYGVVCAVCAVLASELQVEEKRSSDFQTFYTLHHRTLVAGASLRIYNAAGRLVAELSVGESITLKPGVFFIRAEGENEKVVVF